MAFDPMNKEERENLLKMILSVTASACTYYEKLLVLCWIYELILSYTAEKAGLTVVAYDLVKKHFGKERLFMQTVKTCRDNFVHRGILPTDNYYSAIKRRSCEFVVDTFVGYSILDSNSISQLTEFLYNL